MADRLRIGIAGLGTVAQGVLAILREQNELLTARIGRELEVAAVASRTRHNVDLLGGRFDHDVLALAEAPDVDVVVELIGGEGVALELVEAALRAGKPVVTANKAIVALAGDRLLDLAERAGVRFAFEASVAGGIPIIEALTRSLVANDFRRVTGIINGTTNFILSAMESRSLSFEACLQEAQGLGYAEADPTFDVEGVDAAHKLTILAALAFGLPFDRDAVPTEGITAVSAEDIVYARELGYRIKHLGLARRTEEGVDVRVHPALVPLGSKLAAVDDVMNAVEVLGDATGSTFYLGPGAGGSATASAVLADVCSIARGEPSAIRSRAFGAPPERVPLQNVLTANYLRLPVRDQPGVFARVATVLSEHGISIEGAIQRERAITNDTVPIVVVTQPVTERATSAALAKLSGLPELVGPVKRIRVEHLES